MQSADSCFSNIHIYRYYACAVLDFIHRSKALAVWSKLARGEEVSLEAALGAYDMFVLHDNIGDFQEVCLSYHIAVYVRISANKLA